MPSYSHKQRQHHHVSFHFLLIQILPIRKYHKDQANEKDCSHKALDFTLRNGKLVLLPVNVNDADHVADWMSDLRVKEFKQDSGKINPQYKEPVRQYKGGEDTGGRRSTRFIMLRFNADWDFHQHSGLQPAYPTELLSHEKLRLDTILAT
jgi:hypothetical protein